MGQEANNLLFLPRQVSDTADISINSDFEETIGLVIKYVFYSNAGNNPPALGEATMYRKRRRDSDWLNIKGKEWSLSFKKRKDELLSWYLLHFS